MPTIDEAVRYPMEGEDWLMTILIGGVLTIFGFLIIPLLAVYGYLLRVIKRSLEKDPQPPSFGDWGDIVIDGVKVAVIGIVYSIIPTIVFGVTVGGSIIAMATGTRGGAAAGAAGLTVGFLLSVVLSLVFGYVGVAGLINFAAEDRLGAAFEVGTLSMIVLSREYAVAWLLAVAVFLVAGIVAGVLNIVPFLGAIAGAFIFFYAQIVAVNLWAGGYLDAKESSLKNRSSMGDESTT